MRAFYHSRSYLNRAMGRFRPHNIHILKPVIADFRLSNAPGASYCTMRNAHIAVSVSRGRWGDGKEPIRTSRCASSQPHDKPIRVAPQKAIIIKIVKTAPAPRLPRTGAILISRSRRIHGFFVRLWSFFWRERYSCESFKEMAYWVSYRSLAYLRRAICSATEPGNVR